MKDKTAHHGLLILVVQDIAQPDTEGGLMHRGDLKVPSSNLSHIIVSLQYQQHWSFDTSPLPPWVSLRCSQERFKMVLALILYASPARMPSLFFPERVMLASALNKILYLMCSPTCAVLLTYTVPAIQPLSVCGILSLKKVETKVLLPPKPGSLMPLCSMTPRLKTVISIASTQVAHFCSICLSPSSRISYIFSHASWAGFRDRAEADSASWA